MAAARRPRKKQKPALEGLLSATVEEALLEARFTEADMRELAEQNQAALAQFERDAGCSPPAAAPKKPRRRPRKGKA